MKHQLTCREFIEFLSDYVEGTLPAGRRQTFGAHLRICPACVDYLESFRETLRLGREAFGDLEGPPPADAPPKLIAAILSALPR